MRPTREGQLVRLLGRRDVLALAFGAMVGWSWVVLTGEWIASAGSLGAILAFLAGGVAVGLIGLTYAELAAALPFAGGEHVYSLRALGPGGSFVCTWAIVLAYVSVCAFEAVALPTVVTYLVPGAERGFLWRIAGWDVHASWVAIGVLGAVAMTAVNVLGIRVAAALQSLVLVAVLAVGGVFIAGATLSGGSGGGGAAAPPFVDGLSGVTVVLVMVPFMLVGFDVIPQAAEEIDLPFAAIGRLLLVSVGLASAWYALIVLAVGLTMGGEALRASELVTADASSRVLGRIGGPALVVAGLAGILTSWNAFLVGASRALYALARAEMLPAALGRLHPRYNTPHRAILLVGALSLAAPFFGRPALVFLVNAGGVGVVVAYGLVALSFLVLRRREPELERPFRVPHGRAVGGVALVLAAGLAGLYLPGSPAALAWPAEWAIVLGWSGLGALLYALARARAAGGRALGEEVG